MARVEVGEARSAGPHEPDGLDRDRRQRQQVRRPGPMGPVRLRRGRRRSRVRPHDHLAAWLPEQPGLTLVGRAGSLTRA
jgi:hypothetical protein